MSAKLHEQTKKNVRLSDLLCLHVQFLTGAKVSLLNIDIKTWTTSVSGLINYIAGGNTLHSLHMHLRLPI